MEKFEPVQCECFGWEWVPEFGEWNFEDHHPRCPKKNSSRNKEEIVDSEKSLKTDSEQKD